MSFISVPISRQVGGFGPREAKIVLIGEALGAEEAWQGKPFVGPAWSVLEQCLHAAGLIRGECYITNVVKEKPNGNIIDPWYSSTKRQFTDLGRRAVDALHAELAELKPNVIVTLGAVAMHAMTGYGSVLKMRGYVMDGLTGVKVIPTIHPAASLRGQYIYRYLISSDLKKAKLQSAFPELLRPERDLVYNFFDIDEAVDWVHEMGKASRLSIDIEVLNYELALLGMASSEGLAISLPMADRQWNNSDEVPLWRAIQDVLANPYIVKVFQNGIFDIHFLATKCGFLVRGQIEDTMIAHSLMYPDMLKGLGFLGSLYCGSQEYWKDMVKFDDIKENS